MTGKEEERNQVKPSWRVRRRIILSSLIFCAVSVGYAQVFQTVEMVQAVLPAVSIFASAIIGSYVFGAVWDDKGVSK